MLKHRQRSSRAKAGKKGLRLSLLLLASAVAIPVALAQEPVQPAPTAEAPLAAPAAPPISAPADSAATMQPPQMTTPPVAIVPVDASVSGAAVSVSGPMQAWNGRAFITSSGEITAGASSAQVTLPYRGTLNICPATTAKLSVDPNVPAAQIPGLLIAIDSGAIEANFAVAKNADVVMTPDLRIMISGAGAASVKVRLGEGGDTCVDNSGTDAPYVAVTSMFDGGLYRVQPGQRVLFQHGNLQSVVEHQSEPCGCPPSSKHANDFPVAQSQSAPIAQPPHVIKGGDSTQGSEVLSYNGATRSFANGTSRPTPSMPAGTNTVTSLHAPRPEKKAGKNVFVHVGHFFKWFFGAES